MEKPGCQSYVVIKPAVFVITEIIFVMQIKDSLQNHLL